MAHTNVDKLNMLLIYGKSNKNAKAAKRMYQLQFPNRPQPDRKTFSNLCNNLLQYGSFKKLKRERIRTARTQENTALVLQTVNNDPHSSLRQIRASTNISLSSCQRILKENKYFPYKPHLLHHLLPTDYDRRLTFLAEFSVLYEGNCNFLKNVLWSDESKFHSNGTITKHNCRYWSENNPRWMIRTRNQTVFSVNVWCGFLNGYIIGPFLYHENLTGVRYLRFLENELPRLLQNVPHNRAEIWFQQDGAPPHNSNIVINYLNNTFPRRWIGTSGPVRWPARSPDLTPLDFFLWGYLKSQVYQEPIEDMADLYNKIYACAGAINRHTLLRTCNEELLHRFDMCIQANGSNFEHLL